MRKKEVEKEVKKLEEAFALWENKSKKGEVYYTGSDLHKNKLIGFINNDKKNVKEPDVRIYEKNDKGEVVKEVASLWYTMSKDNKTEYLSGTTSDNEKIICFKNSYKNEKNNEPVLRAYFKESE